ncbi:Agamous-like MADS-box protein AGL80 [Euphorbia peplus]|nr:Agamous-like MADS-box protein AGL80 [Euphorbia peplus]
MTRKKVKLVWIVNDTARKASLKKRRAGLTKKVSELTTLCGVKAFVIIYSPDEPEPTLWPNRREVEEMVARYQSIPEMERSKKMMNQESYLKERMGKIQEQAKKNSKKNRDAEMSFLMNKLHIRGWEYDVLELDEVRCLTWLVEERMRDTRKRVEYFQQTPPLLPSAFLPQGEERPGTQVGADAPPPPLPPPPPVSFDERVQHAVGEFRANPTDSMMWDQWFLEMVRNTDNVAGGSGSGSGAPRTRTPPPPSPPPLMPQDFNFGGFATGGDDAGDDLSLGLPLSGGNPFEFPMTPREPNPFGIGLSPRDFGGSSSNANHLGLGPTQPRSIGDVGASSAIDEGLSGIFASGSDVAGLPWPPNFSP